MINKTNRKICIATSPMQGLGGSYIQLEKFLELFQPLASEIYFITGNFPKEKFKNLNINFIKIKSHTRQNTPIPLKIFWYFVVQLQISFELIKLNKKIGREVFLLMGVPLLPIVTLKLLGKRSILTTPASNSRVTKFSYKGFLPIYNTVVTYGLVFLEKSCQYLSDLIILDSFNLVNELGLRNFEHKIITTGALFVDENQFKLERDIAKRNNIVGYVGRLSEEKGVLTFLKAIPLILQDNDSISFLIVGEGPLGKIVEEFIQKNELSNKVKLNGWVSHDKLSNYLNELKIIIIPSYTEALPNILLEAMSCGTPVLASSVGSIPDLIKEGKTGFILDINSAEEIATRVKYILECPNLKTVVNNAKKLIHDEFNLDASIRRYREIILKMEK